MDATAPAEQPLSYGAIVRLALPACSAVTAFALSIGVIARSNGFGWAAPTVFSLTTYAGASQAAALGVLTGGGGVVAACVAGILVNLRYLPVGISVASCFKGGPFRRFLESQVVADVNWALAHQGGGRYDRRILLGAGVLMWALWVVGTVVGLAIGGSLDPKALGLDGMIPGMFVALLATQLREPRARLAALVAIGLTLATVPFVPPGIPVVVGALAVLLGRRRGA